MAIIRSLPAWWRVEAVFRVHLNTKAKAETELKEDISWRKNRCNSVLLMMAWRPPRSALLLVLRERTVNREVTTDAIKKAAHPRGLLGIILRGSRMYVVFLTSFLKLGRTLHGILYIQRRDSMIMSWSVRNFVCLWRRPNYRSPVILYFTLNNQL